MPTTSSNPESPVTSPIWEVLDFTRVPKPAAIHLKHRVEDRGISFDQLKPMIEWAANNPPVPPREWYKIFPDFILVGNGTTPTSVLSPHMKPRGIKLAATPPTSEAFKAWFGSSKVVDSQGNPLPVYRGDYRGDQFGKSFNKGKSISGGFFFTDDPEIASSYATGKPDENHLEKNGDYKNWFRFPELKYKGERQAPNLEQAWYRLSPEQKKRVEHVVRNSRQGDYPDEDKFVHDTGQGITSKDSLEWTAREHRGNWLLVAEEYWLSGGTLFGEERRFVQLLNEMGLHPDFDDPNEARSTVMAVYLHIVNPLETGNIPQRVYDRFHELAKADRSRTRPDSGTWNKESYTLKQWVQGLDNDVKDGTSYAWTTLPDKVISALQSMGYDGVKDTGGKNGGASHTVWIAFTPYQVKSAIGNNGKFDPDSKNITASSIKCAACESGDCFSHTALSGPNIQSIIREILPHLDSSLPIPEVKIVNNVGSRWLGRCLWVPEADNTVVKLQKSILGDAETLKRILAHELCHHAEYLLFFKGKCTNYARTKMLDRLYGNHGHPFQEQADKLNAIYGDGYVTAISDESMVVAEAEKPYYVLLKNTGKGRIHWAVMVRPNQRQKDYVANVLKDPAYKLVQSTDPKLSHGTRVAPGLTSYSSDEDINTRLQDLWDNAPSVELGVSKSGNLDTDGPSSFFEPVQNEHSRRPLRASRRSRYADPPAPRPAVESTPAFKAWFGNSKVVDLDGNPIIVYHGAPDTRFAKELSTAIFKSHTQKHWEVSSQEAKDKDQPAFWFAAHAAVARTYADDTRAWDYQNAEPGTIAVYLKIENPYIIDRKGEKWNGSDESVAEAYAGGHDGIIIKNTIDTYHPGGKSTTVYVVFKSNQIKSANNNNGNFDGSHPSIMASSKKTKASFLQRPK